MKLYYLTLAVRQELLATACLEYSTSFFFLIGVILLESSYPFAVLYLRIFFSHLYVWTQHLTPWSFLQLELFSRGGVK